MPNLRTMMRYFAPCLITMIRHRQPRPSIKAHTRFLFVITARFSVLRCLLIRNTNSGKAFLEVIDGLLGSLICLVKVKFILFWGDEGLSISYRLEHFLHERFNNLYGFN